MDNISKSIQQYKDVESLQQFSEAQQKIIVQLSKKIQKIEEERDHLKTLLESSVPLIKKEGEQLGEKFLTTSEEAICLMQLEMLRDFSAKRELTLEETRKVEIYSKILTAVRNAPKTIEIKNKQMTSEELLALVESDDSGSTK